MLNFRSKNDTPKWTCAKEYTRRHRDKWSSEICISWWACCYALFTCILLFSLCEFFLVFTPKICKSLKAVFSCPSMYCLVMYRAGWSSRQDSSTIMVICGVFVSMVFSCILFSMGLNIIIYTGIF